MQGMPTTKHLLRDLSGDRRSAGFWFTLSTEPVVSFPSSHLSVNSSDIKFRVWLAMLMYHRQHWLRRSKKWPWSKPKWLKILTQHYLFISEICTIMAVVFRDNLAYYFWYADILKFCEQPYNKPLNMGHNEYSDALQPFQCTVHHFLCAPTLDHKLSSLPFWTCRCLSAHYKLTV